MRRELQLDWNEFQAVSAIASERLATNDFQCASRFDTTAIGGENRWTARGQSTSLISLVI